MELEIADVQPIDIKTYLDILKLDKDFNPVQLYENFRSLSRCYHQSVRPKEAERFGKIVIAFEVLNYLRRRKKIKGIEDLLIEWNQTEKAKVIQEIAYFKTLNLDNYTKKIDYNPLGFKIFKGFFIFIFASILLMIFGVYLIKVFDGSLNLFGIFYFGLMFSGLILYQFKEGGLFRN